MILKFIIQGIIGLLYIIFGLLPSPTSTDTTNIAAITGGIGSIRGFFTSQNFWFPVDKLFMVIGLIVALELASFLFKVFRWIASNISAGILK